MKNITQADIDTAKHDLEFYTKTHNVAFTKNYEKIIKAKLRMFGNYQVTNCPCDQSGERFCISEKCKQDIQRDGHCHCNLYKDPNKDFNFDELKEAVKILYPSAFIYDTVIELNEFYFHNDGSITISKSMDNCNIFFYLFKNVKFTDMLMFINVFINNKFPYLEDEKNESRKSENNS